jgi:hypothetical protein
MPNAVQLEQSMGKGGAATATATMLNDLRDEERRGRLVRDAQVAENCIVQAQFTATFSAAAAETGQVASEWIDFGRIKFTEAPAVVGGSFRMRQTGETELNTEASNYDPDTHEAVPCIPMGLKWRIENGHYTGAKVLAFALASVTDGYKALISVAFIGPGVRMG